MAKPLNVPGSKRPSKPIEIVLPKLTSYQQEVHDWLGDPFEKGKVAIIKSQRQVGKSLYLQCELTLMAFNHPGSTSIIFEPSISLARNVYKSMAKAFSAIEGLLKVNNAQLLELEFVNGSTILFKSTEQVTRGLSCSGLLCLDEGAYLDPSAIFEILPLVNAHNASLILASTPFTMDGYFYDMYLKGLEGDENIRTFDWSSHPETAQFLTEEKKTLYKATMSKQKYTTEILGEFLSKEDGYLFRISEDCLGEPEHTDIIYMGIDFATGGASENENSDYSVLAVFNNRGEMINIHRTNELTPMQQVEWLSNLILGYAGKYTVKTILAEKNSIGSVYIDALTQRIKGRNIVITNWVTSNKSKQDLISELELAFDTRSIKLLADSNLTQVFLNELRQYQAVINPTTHIITYGGHNGVHDDCVMAIAFAYHAYKQSLGNFRIAFA